MRDSLHWPTGTSKQNKTSFRLTKRDGTLLTCFAGCGNSLHELVELVERARELNIELDGRCRVDNLGILSRTDLHHRLRHASNSVRLNKQIVQG